MQRRTAAARDLSDALLLNWRPLTIHTRAMWSQTGKDPSSSIEQVVSIVLGIVSDAGEAL